MKQRKMSVHDSIGTLPAMLMPWIDCVVSLTVGAVAAFVICLIARHPWPDRAGLAATPWPAWVGGLLDVPVNPATAWKLLGVGLVVGGVAVLAAVK